MALYFYFNATTGDLVYSDRSAYSGSGYTSLGQQTNTRPLYSTEWVFHSRRSTIKTVTKDPAFTVKISVLSSMQHMFNGCSSLTSVDLSGFDTSKVAILGNMFGSCSSVTSLDLSGFDTSKVTNMATMFDGCSSLTSVDLSGFDTSKVTSMQNMFGGCSSLTSLDLSGFDTSKVTNMTYMFGGCSSLTSLDLSGFDTSKVTNMAIMFNGCSALRIIDISPNMSNVLSQLPAATYYDAATKQSYAKANIPGGSTYVRNLADLDLMATMIQNRQAVRSLRHIVNGLSRRVVALETSVSSLK